MKRNQLITASALFGVVLVAGTGTGWALCERRATSQSAPPAPKAETHTDADAEPTRTISEVVTVFPMSRRRVKSLRLAALMLGLAALLVMHAITYPAGHLAHGSMSMGGETSSMVAATVSQAGPANASHHAQATSHGEMAQACLAAVLSVVAVTLLQHSVRRRTGARERRPLTVFSGPEPPVPRLSFAL